jgi:hypothetical protein
VTSYQVSRSKNYRYDKAGLDKYALNNQARGIQVKTYYTFPAKEYKTKDRRDAYK